MTKDLFDNIIITGSHTTGGYYPTIGIWKLDTGGVIIKIKNLSFSGYSSIDPYCIKSTIDTGYIIVGDADSVDSLYNNHPDALIIKIDSAFNAPLITSVINNYSNNKPKYFELYQNYPNPFNSSTKVRLILPSNGYINISIYDVLGKKVFSNKEYKYIGLNAKNFDFSALSLSSGVYFIKFNFDSYSKLIKAIYLK